MALLSLLLSPFPNANAMLEPLGAESDGVARGGPVCCRLALVEKRRRACRTRMPSLGASAGEKTRFLLSRSRGSWPRGGTWQRCFALRQNQEQRAVHASSPNRPPRNGLLAFQTLPCGQAPAFSHRSSCMAIVSVCVSVFVAGQCASGFCRNRRGGVVDQQQGTERERDIERESRRSYASQGPWDTHLSLPRGALHV